METAHFLFSIPTVAHAVTSICLSEPPSPPCLHLAHNNYRLAAPFPCPSLAVTLPGLLLICVCPQPSAPILSCSSSLSQCCRPTLRHRPPWPHPQHQHVTSPSTLLHWHHPALAPSLWHRPPTSSTNAGCRPPKWCRPPTVVLSLLHRYRHPMPVTLASNPPTMKRKIVRINK
jgi:hypothetical protein